MNSCKQRWRLEFMFVDEQNIDQVFGGEDSDVNGKTSDSENSEGEGDRSDDKSKSEEESEEDSTDALKAQLRR